LAKSRISTFTTFCLFTAQVNRIPETCRNWPLPLLVLFIVYLLGAAREERHFWKRTYMGSSWAVKFAVSVLGWLLFLVLISTLGISLRQDEASGEVALLVSTAVYWMLYTLVYVRLRKYKPKGEEG
jgi:hypothetical protein